MASPFREFRLSFFDDPACTAEIVLGDAVIVAADFDAAIWKASTMARAWPTGARACRLFDVDTGEVAYRFSADRDGREVMIVKFA